MQVIGRLGARVRTRPQRLLALVIVMVLYASLAAVGVRHSFTGQTLGAGRSSGGSSTGLGGGGTENSSRSWTLSRAGGSRTS